MSFKSISELGNLAGKRALVRVDLNVPMQGGQVSDDNRIKTIIPTVKLLLGKGAKVILLSHFGRPKGQVVPKMSLRPLVKPLELALGVKIAFGSNCVGAEADKAVNSDAAVVLLENVRFHKCEEANGEQFTKGLAAHGDIYVNDAFSCAHRAHASTTGLAKLLPSYAGLTMSSELSALEAALGDPARPLGAVVGGAKVSSKLNVLTNLVSQVEHLIIGGGMANTFLAALGHNVGVSLCEHDLTDTAKAIMEKAKKCGCEIHLPSDVVVAKEFAPNPASLRTIALDEIANDEMILDIGPASAQSLISVIKECKTLIWNGPLGAFEMEPFDQATVKLAQAAAALTIDGKLLSVAGGGDTVAALNQAGVKASFSHVSTAGGAFLEWMEGKELPGVTALEI
jgi:phosphoglycerate kinase